METVEAAAPVAADVEDAVAGALSRLAVEEAAVPAVPDVGAPAAAAADDDAESVESIGDAAALDEDADDDEHVDAALDDVIDAAAADSAAVGAPVSAGELVALLEQARAAVRAC